jgi:hypothetical protein
MYSHSLFSIKWNYHILLYKLTQILETVRTDFPVMNIREENRQTLKLKVVWNYCFKILSIINWQHPVCFNNLWCHIIRNIKKILFKNVLYIVFFLLNFVHLTFNVPYFSPGFTFTVNMQSPIKCLRDFNFKISKKLKNASNRTSLGSDCKDKYFWLLHLVSHNNMCIK